MDLSKRRKVKKCKKAIIYSVSDLSERTKAMFSKNGAKRNIICISTAQKTPINYSNHDEHNDEI